MRKSNLLMYTKWVVYILLATCITFSFCNKSTHSIISKSSEEDIGEGGSSPKTKDQSKQGKDSSIENEQKSAPQIGNYIVEIFEDSKGNLWFGTMSKGAGKYDGASLDYLTMNNGLVSNAVVSITEDKDGSIWFGSQAGLTKYNGRSVKNYTTANGLCHNRVSKLYIDSSNIMWIGTWGGVCLMDLNQEQPSISSFDIPAPRISIPSYQETAEWVTDIMEDKYGNIWISRSGYGVCRYNRANNSDNPDDDFTLFTNVDGLPSNCVQVMQEDAEGSIWLGCRVAERDHPDEDKRIGPGGLCKFNPTKKGIRAETFEKFPNVPGLIDSDVYSIYNDESNNVWIGVNGTGLYEYDGKSFKLYSESNRPDIVKGMNGVQSMLQDRQGRIWIGLSGGLFRYIDGEIVNVSTDGPWGN